MRIESQYWSIIASASRDGKQILFLAPFRALDIVLRSSL
jgi:hypothetical protein